MLFKPELCKQILAGEKTETRRIVKEGEDWNIVRDGYGNITRQPDAVFQYTHYIVSNLVNFKR